jgi:hypothetical protein
MQKFFHLFASLFLFSLTIYASDTLKLEKKRIVSVKSNMAVLLLSGFSLQTEYIADQHKGYWIEAVHHREEQSVFNCPLKETNILLGINYYKPFKNPINTKVHNGAYLGPYLKYRQGYYCLEKEINYSAVLIGIQGGIQSVSKQNIIFTMGMGCGIGYFIKQADLTYSSLFSRYHLPLLDFRATISLGYMF